MSNISNNIVLGGTGQVAWVLGQLLVAAGQPISKVVGRHLESAEALARALGAEAATWDSFTAQPTDCVLLAVRDDALAGLVQNLEAVEAIWLHTSGAVPHHVLAALSPNHGAFYPLQSLRKEIRPPGAIPFLITTSNGKTDQVARGLAAAIHSSVRAVTDAERLRYHVAAVIANNFTNHLLAETERFCVQSGLDFGQLYPLLEETIARIREASPAQLQTGPAVRGDEQTKAAHLGLLTHNPSLTALYQFMWQAIRASQQTIK